MPVHKLPGSIHSLQRLAVNLLCSIRLLAKSLSRKLVALRKAWPDDFANVYSQEEIDRARNKTLARAVIRAERPMGRLLPLGSCYTYLGRYVSLDEEIAAFDKVTVDQVRELIEQYPLRPMALSSVGPRMDLKPVD